MSSVEAMKQALEALELNMAYSQTMNLITGARASQETFKAITSLRHALNSAEAIDAASQLTEAEPSRSDIKQEPVVWLCEPDENGLYGLPLTEGTCTKCFPVYRYPPQRQPLYPREIKDVLRATGYVTNSQAWELAEEVMKLLNANGIKGEA